MKFFYFAILFSLCFFCGKKNHLEGKDIEKDSPRKKILAPPILEKKFSEIFKEEFKAYEGSGVYYKSNEFFIVFDNLDSVGRINSDLTSGQLLGSKKMKSNFEGLTFDSIKQKFFILVESSKTNNGFFPEILELDAKLKLLKRKFVNFELTKKNKGFEGLVSLHRNGKHFILALCEGNFCYSDKEKHKGNGRIQVLSETEKEWGLVAEIILPSKAAFLDYSDMDIHENKLIILSQSSSAIWIGDLSETKWEITDRGEVLFFPIKKTYAELQYCNLEGISWISERKFVAVSDKKNDSQNESCKEKEQMIHTFDLPYQ